MAGSHQGTRGNPLTRRNTGNAQTVSAGQTQDDVLKKKASWKRIRAPTSSSYPLRASNGHLGGVNN